MATLEDQLRSVEDELANTKYNKATQGHIGRLKAKLASLKEKQEVRRAKSGGGGISFAVPKSGHATVAIVGLPSVGKSTLLNALTNQESETAAYAFTTLDVIPGLLEHKDAKVQILDLPGIIEGASAGKGRGREVLSVVRGADLILFMLDVYQPEAIRVLMKEVESVGLRINRPAPDIKISKTLRGGIKLLSTLTLTQLDLPLVRGVLNEMGYVNADVVVREDAGVDRLIDAIAHNRVYTRGIVALSKTDLAPALVRSAQKLLEDQGWIVVPVSATTGKGLDGIRDAIVQNLDLIRVWLKPQGAMKPDEPPLVIKRGSTIATVCRTLHRGFEANFKYAVVTGPSTRFPEQRVGLEHGLKDRDVVTIITKKGLEK